MLPKPKTGKKEGIGLGFVPGNRACERGRVRRPSRKITECGGRRLKSRWLDSSPPAISPAVRSWEGIRRWVASRRFRLTCRDANGPPPPPGGCDRSGSGRKITICRHNRTSFEESTVTKGFRNDEIKSAVRIISVSTASNVVWKKEVSPTNVG